MKGLHAEVHPWNGVPWLHVNGQPFTKNMYTRGLDHPDRFWCDVREQVQAGAGLILFNSNCASDFYSIQGGDAWVDEDTFDYRGLDVCMKAAQDIDPELLLMPNLQMVLPRWWEDAHPEEIQRFHDGSVEAKFDNHMVAERNRVVSLASERWAEDMTRCLERYLEYAEAEYGDRIAGYAIVGGITHEWGLLGSFDFIDYSEPMRRYWREWARKEYDGRPPYDSEEIPPRGLRLLEEGSFRNPAAARAALDYQRCLSDLTVERITGFCDVVKRKTSGRKVTFTYYGYTLTCREGGLDLYGQFLGRYGCGGFQGGHLSMSKLLRSKAVDIVASPFSYENRRLGEGDFQPHYAETSVQRHGKVSMLQDDNRSWTGPLISGIDIGRYDEPERFLLQLRRAWARRICGDEMFHLADIEGGNYDAPMILAEIARLQTLFERHVSLRSPSEADVLIVVDEDAIPYLSLSSGVQYQNVYRQSSHWARTGAPYHVMLLDDAAKADPEDYALVILTNTVHTTPRLEAWVAQARAAGVSLLFLAGSGLVGPRGPERALASALTGVDLEWVSREPCRLTAEYDDGAGGAATYENERPISHMLAAADPEAEAWSMIAGTDRPALAAKPRCGAAGGWDAYAGVTPVPWPLLGRLVALAGGHRYGTQGERIWKSSRLLGVHIGNSERLTLTLRPGERVVAPILAPRDWNQDGDRLALTMEPYETSVFQIEPRPA